MKETFPGGASLAFLAAAVFFWPGCLGPADSIAPSEIERASRLQESLDRWVAQRDAHQGTYRYTTVFVSWTGFRATTTLVVRDNAVVERHYESSAPTAEGERSEASWRETEPEQLGLHAEGAAVKTIDELYAECAATVLTQNPSQNDISLEFRNDGILHRCTYVPNACADDCEQGVRVDRITFAGASQVPN